VSDVEPGSSLALELRGLEKAYRIGHLRPVKRPILKGLDLAVPRGGIFGYLGPNGSGKTTTLKLVVGLLRADAGTVTVLGLPASSRDWRYRVGYLPENPYLYDYLTAREYLEYVGRLFGLPAAERSSRAGRLLREVGMERSADVALRRVSKGMLQRVGIAQALVNDPELVILDEPMSGLDPIGRHMVRQMILRLKDAGKTIFFSTHILSDAEVLCDRVAMLRDGRVVTAGRLDEILAPDVAHMEVLVGGLEPRHLAELRDALHVRPVGERALLHVPEASLAEVVRTVQQARGRILSVQPARQSLEEIFVRETGPSAGGGVWED